MLNLKEKYDKCWHCENFYGPCFGEPLCITCHYFVHPFEAFEELNTATATSGSSRSNSIQNVHLSDEDDATLVKVKLECSQLINTLESDNLVAGAFNNLPTTSSKIYNGHKPNKLASQKLELNDSGNEDSDETAPLFEAATLTDSSSSSSASSIRRSSSASNFYKLLNNNNYYENGNLNCVMNRTDVKTAKNASGWITLELDAKLKPIRQGQLPKRLLGDQIVALSTFDKVTNKPFDSGIIDSLPTEVWLNIFRRLDDLSLWAVSQVCKRWHTLIEQEIAQEHWKTFISERWIFYKPSVQVKCYRTLYDQLVQSSSCFYCLQNIQNRLSSACKEEVKKSWRHKRLILELKALQQDPMPGINARPLDASFYYWQASITGPVSSPYEGGTFYLFLIIPQGYPLAPPMVKFITKIYHPNISKHGDIGLDSIHENWSLALTISKVLISIQSLLTDPYTNVCMENDIGHIYRTNRDLYERTARQYTWKYAMSDYVLFDCTQNELIASLSTNEP